MRKCSNLSVKFLLLFVNDKGKPLNTLGTHLLFKRGSWINVDIKILK